MVLGLVHDLLNYTEYFLDLSFKHLSEIIWHHLQSQLASTWPFDFLKIPHLISLSEYLLKASFTRRTLHDIFLTLLVLIDSLIINI